MRKIRIYQNGNYQPRQIITLSASASQHVGRVLRMQSGEKITLFNGDNHEYLATITNIDKREVTVTIENSLENNIESPLKIHLAQAISKGDKMEFVIQKAVELGAASITPLITTRSIIKLDEERLTKKHSQWQAIAIAACEQSGRNTIPEIKIPCLLTKYLQQSNTKNKLILFPKAQKSWRNYPNISNEVSLLIGPEGGLDDEEIKQASQFQFQPLSLGPRVLRTETATITAISVLQALFGDL